MRTIGYHVMPAIPPWCAEARTRAELVQTMANGRVLLRDLEMAVWLPQGRDYLIDTGAASFVPDAPNVGVANNLTGQL